VRVAHVTKYRAAPATFVRIWTAASRFSITADHRLLVQGEDGKAKAAQAQSLLHTARQGCHVSIYNGEDFVRVSRIEPSEEQMPVVEVRFDPADAAVLAWYPSRRPQSMRSSSAFACLGRPRTAADALNGEGFVVTNTFYGERAQAPPRWRSLSEGATPSASMSKGTLCHEDAFPSRCSVCAVHHRYLCDVRNPTQAGIATPCQKGAACPHCHAPHAELDRELRLRKRL